MLYPCHSNVVLVILYYNISEITRVTMSYPCLQFLRDHPKISGLERIFHTTKAIVSAYVQLVYKYDLDLTFLEIGWVHGRFYKI